MDIFLILPPPAQWAEGHFEIWGAPSSQPKSQHTKPTILRQPWRPPPPHMTTFPRSYGNDITPIERKSPLLHTATVGYFFLLLDLRRRPTYVAAHNTTIFRQPWPPPMLYPSPYEHLPTDSRPRYYTHRETISYNAYDNCRMFFNGAGFSVGCPILPICTKTNDSSSPWPPPSYVDTFQHSLGNGITPIDMQSPKLQMGIATIFPRLWPRYINKPYAE